MKKNFFDLKFFDGKFFGGFFVAALIYTILLVFQSDSFVAIVSCVFANLSYVFFMLNIWNTCSPRGKFLSVVFMIGMDIAFLLFVYHKVLAL